ncbi:hypothetical protein DNTS_029943, partial [Danionella cerebrum]
MGITEAFVIIPLSQDENRQSGETVTLSCSYKNYTGTVQNLQWYRKYPKSKPEFLLYIFEHGAMSENGPERFSAEVYKGQKQVDLKISSVAETDSAMYYCALVPTVTGNTRALHDKPSLKIGTTTFIETMLLLCLILIFNCIGGTMESEIKPDQESVLLTESTNATLSCSYTGSVDSLFWYQQKPGSRPQFLMMIDESSKYVTKASPPHPRMSIKLHKDEKRHVKGNVISPAQTSVVSTEGRNITLSCTVDTTAYSFHWYQQMPGSQPEFLLLIVRSTKTVVQASPPQPHMSITLSEKRVDLEISSASVSDSAMYYCALEPTLFTLIMLLMVFLVFSLPKENAGEEIITPHFKVKHVLEGDDITLSCNYTGATQNLWWYRQFSGSKPESLILFFETIPQSEGRLFAVADKATKRMNLTVSSTTLKDSAMYYCALVPTVTGNTRTSNKNS